MSINARLIADAAEEAFLYDLSVAPLWREAFNQILDEEVELPQEGEILDLGCGTGDYAVSAAVRLGAKGRVHGVDPSEARLNIAQAKASVKKLDNISFHVGSVSAPGVFPESFDFVIADLGWHPQAEIPLAIKHTRELARPGATIALLCATRGSFDEFHSIYWETLYRESLLEYSPRIEALALDRPTTTDLESFAKAAHLQRVHSVTQKQLFAFDDGSAFLTSPLIANYFMPDWVSLMAEAEERSRVLKTLPQVIDDARDGGPFEVSIKATVLTGVR